MQDLESLADAVRIARPPQRRQGIPLAFVGMIAASAVTLGAVVAWYAGLLSRRSLTWLVVAGVALWWVSLAALLIEPKKKKNYSRTGALTTRRR
jgi:hypothetical protein